MWNRLFGENPFLLIYAGRLRRQRRWAHVGTAVAALAAGSMASGLALGPLAPVAAAWLMTCWCLLLWSQGCVAHTVMSLGQNGNLEELLPANLPPDRIADSATAFVTRRWLKLTPWALAGSLWLAQPWLIGVACLLWLLALPGGCCSVYASTLHLLVREGHVPWTRVVALGVRGLLFTSVLMMPLVFARSLAEVVTWGLLMNLPLQIFSLIESRRLVVQWLSNPRPSRPTPVRAGRPRWLMGAASNPLLFRYGLTRRHWRGQPVWLLLSLLCGSMLGLTLLVSEPLAGVLAFYTVLGCTVGALALHLRYLHEELRSGNYELIASALSRREVVDHLAQVGYLPRLFEIIPFAGAFLLALAISHPEHLPPVLMAAGGLGFWWTVQAVIASYVNVGCALALRKYQSQLSLLHGVAMLVQFLVICLPGWVLLAGESVIRFCQDGPSSPYQLLSLGLLWLVSLAGLAWGTRKLAVRLA